MLRDLRLKGVYKSDVDNILEDFYLPALSVANVYDRAVGFFSASTISLASQALSAFVNNGGRMRLVLGAFSDREDLEAIAEGYRKREICERIGAEFLTILSSVNDELFRNRFETLAWLVYHGRLDVKIALREKGMYHDKIGIIGDEKGDRLVFSGSANESTQALLPSFNYESISVFPSWKPELLDYTVPHIESFERLWRNESAATAVVEIPDAVKDKLISVARSMDYQPSWELEAEVATRIKERLGLGKSTASPKPAVPKTTNGRPFEIRSHQRNALQAWKSEGDYQGVLDLATGSGKTVTAMYAIVKLAEGVEGLTCVIAVPYQNLADQWVGSLAEFNIFPIRCYVSRGYWLEKLREAVHELTMGTRSFACIVVVNRTLKSPEFQACLKELDGARLFWIGDECHHHTSASFEGYLPKQARFRLGLSATPKHYIDEERNERLASFYGKIVFHYSLEEAIKEKVLTPYQYYPHLVPLTASEADEFIELSEQIGQMMMRQKEGSGVGQNPQLTALLMRRARLLGSASNKLNVLADALSETAPCPHTLFYCGDGLVESDDDEDDDAQHSIIIGQRQIEVVSSFLHDNGWSVSRFTSRESRKDRERILDNFRLGLIDAMVAIKCLDEGIDVPACAVAYILASSRDPRQFIQRRGRILRRSAGKELAIIHDFIVVMPEGEENASHYAKTLMKSELQRVAEFASLAQNRADSYEVLAPILKRYDLEHMV